MRVHQYIFGKDGGAEQFFLHLLAAFAERGVEQTVVMRPNRRWKPDVLAHARVIESNFRNASIDRLLLPMRVKHLAQKDEADAIISWSTRGATLMPAYAGATKISRLGDYPLRLSYFRNTDIIVCNAPGIADHVRKLGWDRRIEVISNFTRTEKVAAADRAMFDTPADVPLVMAMGRFVQRKGFHTLIDAMAGLPDAWLWLAGEGEEREALEAQARERGIANRMRFIGWQKDARSYLAAADVFVMPSSHEPLGNVVLEAWAQGIPVVSSRSEGPLWFMRDGENGLMVDIDDHQGFSRAISSVLNDRQLANSLVEGGHVSLAAQFSEEAIVQAYFDLFGSHAAARASV